MWREKAFMEEPKTPDPLQDLQDGTFYPKQAQAQIDMGHQEVCLVLPNGETHMHVKVFPGTVLVDGEPGRDARLRTFPRG